MPIVHVVLITCSYANLTKIRISLRCLATNQPSDCLCLTSDFGCNNWKTQLQSLYTNYMYILRPSTVHIVYMYLLWIHVKPLWAPEPAAVTCNYKSILLNCVRARPRAGPIIIRILTLLHVYWGGDSRIQTYIYRCRTLYNLNVVVISKWLFPQWIHEES